MRELFKTHFALTDKGAKDLQKASAASFFVYVINFFPAMLLLLLVDELLLNNVKETGLYLWGSILVLAVMWILLRIEYVRQFAVHPLASVEYVLVPLLLRILQIADQLAVSAVARGAECPGVRKSYYETTMHMRDWCFLALWGIVTAAVLCVGGVKI